MSEEAVEAESGVEEPEVVESTEETPETKTEAPAEPEAPSYDGTKHKVKVNGEEVEVDYEELLSNFQLRQASDEKFRTASEKEKQVSQFIDQLKGKPFDALAQLGLDVDELAEQRVAERMEWQLKPEEERKRLELERELNQYKTKEESWKKQQEEQAQQAEYSKAVQEIDTEIGSALKDAKIKATPRVVARIAEIKLNALNNGEDISAAEAIKVANKSVRTDVVEYLESLPDDELADYIGKNLPKRIQKRLLNEVSEKAQFSTPSASPGTAPSTRDDKSRITTDDFFNNLEQRLG